LLGLSQNSLHVEAGCGYNWRVKTVVLVRHGEAESGGPDYARSLTPGGRRAATRVGLELAERGFVIDRVICSSAVRASRTAELIAREQDAPPPLERTRALYLAEPSVCVHVLQQLPQEVARVVVVGHNPGLSTLARLWMREAINLAPAEYVQVSREIDRWQELR
jgi:phosphohistidine phosphatase